MSRLRALAAGASLAALLLVAPPADAQWAVLDVANLAQNILTAARTLEEVNNQITQIQQFVRMLENQARNLTPLPFSILPQLQNSMGEINGLMSQAQSLAYDVNRVQQQFQSLYPNYSWTVTQAGLLADARSRWTASVDTFQHTMTVQSQIVTAIPTDQAELSALVTQSQARSDRCRRSSRPTSFLPCSRVSSRRRRICSPPMHGRRPRNPCATPKSRRRPAPSGPASGAMG